MLTGASPRRPKAGPETLAGGSVAAAPLRARIVIMVNPVNDLFEKICPTAYRNSNENHSSGTPEIVKFRRG